VGQSVGWRWLGRRQLHGDGPIAQRGGPLRCWEGRVLGAVEHRARAAENVEREHSPGESASHHKPTRLFPTRGGAVCRGCRVVLVWLRDV
jgi:hypothetical protein